MSHSTQNRSLRRRSSQPISWFGTKETKPNTSKASNRGISWYKLSDTKTQMVNLDKHRISEPKPTCRLKNCSQLYHLIPIRCHYCAVGSMVVIASSLLTTFVIQVKPSVRCDCVPTIRFKLNEHLAEIFGVLIQLDPVSAELKGQGHG